MSLIRRSLFFSFVERYAIVGLNLATMAVVARLFTPEELGTIAISLMLSMLLQTLRDFGAANYLIQKHDLKDTDVGAAFSVSFGLSLLAAILLTAGAEPMAAFYDQPLLADVLRISALSFVLLPFLMPMQALLRREMAFNVVALMNISGAVAGFITVATLPFLGFGILSMAWSGIASVLASIAVGAIVRPRLLLVRPSLRGWRSILSFGGLSSATAAVNVAAQVVPQLVLGWSLGTAALGIYNRAASLSQMFERLVVDALHPVVLPALSSEARRGGNLQQVYLHALTLITAVYWPFLVMLALLAEPVVLVLLGDQWTEVVTLVRILAVAQMALFPAFLTYPTLVALGRVRDTLTMSLISIPPSLLVVSGASFVSVEATAAAGLIVYPLQVAVAMFFIRRQLPFRLLELGGALWRSGVVTLAAAGTGGAAFLTVEAGPPLHPVMYLIVVGVFGLLGWTAALFAVGHPLALEGRTLLAQFRSRFSPRPS